MKKYVFPKNNTFFFGHSFVSSTFGSIKMLFVIDYMVWLSCMNFPADISNRTTNNYLYLRGRFLD